ncbi:hypothetical protein pdam_00017738, partial [Pocillopora damicornis]
MTRHGLCIRRKTTESQKDTEKLIDKLIAYVLQARRLRVKFSYSDSDIIAMDETACHVMETVKQELRTSKIDPLIVPGGCTKYIQAPDVVWNKPFKANVTEKYDEWMAGEAHSFTAAGNMRAPARREIVKWILAAWDGLDKTMIINSFKSCALTVALDGLEDGHIHCFKENQPCRAGLQRLK